MRKNTHTPPLSLSGYSTNPTPLSLLQQTCRPSTPRSLQPSNELLNTSPLLIPGALLAPKIGPDLKDGDHALDTSGRKTLALARLPGDLIETTESIRIRGGPGAVVPCSSTTGTTTTSTVYVIRGSGRRPGLGISIVNISRRRLPRGRGQRAGADPRDGDLGLDGEVPDLEVAGAVDEGEHAGAHGGPRGVVDDVLAGDVGQGGDGSARAAVLADVHRDGGGGGGGAHAPQLDGPVEGGRQDQVAEVDGPARRVERHAHDGGGVAAVADAGVDAGFGARAVVAVAGVDGALLGADQEVRRVGLGEGHGGGGQVLELVGRRREERQGLLGLRQHVDAPDAERAVRGDRDDVVRVLRPDDVDRVHGVRVPVARERRLLDRGGLRPRVPEEHLARVRAADDEVRVEGRELRRQDVRLRVEEELGPVVQVAVPHLNDTVRVVGGRRVLRVGGEQELGEGGREVEAAHHALLRPPLVVELHHLLDAPPALAARVARVVVLVLDVVRLQGVVPQDVVVVADV